MIRVDEETSAAGLKIDVSEGREPKPIQRLQHMQNAVLFAVPPQFVVKMKEQLRRHSFDLEAGLVVDPGGRLVFFGTFSADPVGEELVQFGEFVALVGEHFREFRRPQIPRDDVAGTGDVERQLSAVARELAM